MKASCCLCAPVITFLSPNPSASRRAASRLVQWTQQKGSSKKQPLVQQESSSPLRFHIDWDAVVVDCPESGTILQWIAPASAKDRNESSPPHFLLAIQSSDDLQQARERLWEALEESASPTILRISSLLSRSVSAKTLLGRQNQFLPVLDLDLNLNDAASSSSPASPPIADERFGLKELAIPFVDTATYSDGESLLTKLSQSNLSRPVTGLYQIDGLSLRPLPSAEKDHSLPPPSLVFHSTADNAVHETIQPHDGSLIAKIGHTGRMGEGQFMLRHNADLLGLDIRFCPSVKYSSAFAEAQESLLAGSLQELQSNHVLDGADGKVDPRINKMDCWVEFRANMAKPTGFFPSKNKKPLIAKAPDIPYE